MRPSEHSRGGEAGQSWPLHRPIPFSQCDGRLIWRRCIGKTHQHHSLLWCQACRDLIQTRGRSESTSLYCGEPNPENPQNTTRSIQTFLSKPTPARLGARRTDFRLLALPRRPGRYLAPPQDLILPQPGLLSLSPHRRGELSGQETGTEHESHPEHPKFTDQTSPPPFPGP